MAQDDQPLAAGGQHAKDQGQPQLFGVGQIAWKGRIRLSTAVPMPADHRTVVCGVSVLLILRVMISAKAQQKALATPNSAAGWKPPRPGRTTTSMPSIPGDDRGPSPKADNFLSSGMDRTVISSGDRKLMVVACAM